MGKVSCDYCRVSCTSALSLAEHVLGQKHRANLMRTAPEKLAELGRVQYFLNTHLKDQPVLGLEHLVERQVDSVYIYTCRLCNKELEWKPMIAHVLDVEHTERYINKHHNGMIAKLSHLTPLERNQEVAVIASTVYGKYGRKDICIGKPLCSSPSLAAAAGPSSEGSVENGAEPSGGDHLQAACTKESLTEDSVTKVDFLDQKVIPQSSEIKKPSEFFIKYSCSFCDVTCSSAVALCEHILGKVHKGNVELKAPEQLKEIGRLGHFLNTHLKHEPILGLEYIVEMKLGSLYKYTCLLCGVDTNIRKIVAHITDQDHGESYLTKHYKSMLPPVPKHIKKVYMKFLRKSASKILEVHGRKEIQFKNSPASDLIETLKSEEKMKDDMPPSKDDPENSSYLKRRPLPYREQDLDESHGRANTKKMHKNTNIDSPPPAKRGKHFHKYDWDDSQSKPYNLLHRGSRYNQRPPRDSFSLNPKRAVDELEFRTNDELVEYLSKFSIEDDEDALFIQKITQNCIKALKNFQEEEEAEKLSGNRQTEAPHSSRTRRESPDFSRHKSRETRPLKNFQEDEVERRRIKRRAEAHSSRTHRVSPDVSRNKSREHYSSKNFQEEDSERVKRRTEAHSSRSYREPHSSKDFDEDEVERLRVKRRTEVPLSHSSRTRRLSPDVSRNKSRDPRSFKNYKEEEAERLNRRTEVPLAYSSRSRHASPDVSLNKSKEPYPLKNFQEEDAERLRDKHQTEVPLPHSSRAREMSPDVSANKSTEPHSIKNYQEEDADRLRVNRWTEVPLAPSSRAPQLSSDVSALAHSSSTHGMSPDVSANKSTEPYSFKNYQEEDVERVGVNRWTEVPLAHSSRTPQMSLDVSVNNREPYPSTSSEREPQPEMNLQGENTERLRDKHQTEVQLLHSSRTQMSLDVSANKSREPHPSTSSETTFPKNTLNPSSDSVPKNDITNFFFSSIKNMDESEVVGIFQKIVTTNPEFKGMDIPAVIRFLKESGRLKKS